MKILVTAFEPFGGETVNPAMEAVALVENQISGAQIVKAMVPVVFKKAVEIVTAAMEREQPDAVLCVGQAGGRAGLTVERVAINMDDARIPDNEGNQPVDTPICPEGPSAYFSSLPIKRMVSAIQEAGVPASVSNSAGTYVCNHLLYGVLRKIDTSYPGMRAGFLHVPYLHDQVTNRPGVPSLSREDMAHGIEAAIRAIAENG